MDPITHGLVGFFLALLVAKEFGFKNLKWPAAAGVLAAIAPDVDGLALLFNGSGFYTYHRVATHSFIGVILLALIIAILFSRLKKDFIKYLPLALLGVLLHLLLDFVTPAGGVQLFYPFSTARIALSIMPAPDVYLLAILAAGLVVFRLQPKKHVRVAGFVLLFCALLIGARFALASYAEAKVNHMNGESYLLPSLFDPLKWRVVKPDTGYYYISEYSFWGGFAQPAQVSINSGPLIEASKKAKTVRSFISFARFPNAVVDGNIVEWYDIGKGYGTFTATVLLDENMNVLWEKMGLKP